MAAAYREHGGMMNGVAEHEGATTQQSAATAGSSKEENPRNPSVGLQDLTP